MLRNPTAPSGIPAPGEASEVRPTTSAMLNAIIETHADALVGAFYDVLLQHEGAKSFLDHQAVHDRLSPSLNAWLRELFSADAATDREHFAARQKKIGEVHARIKIPIHLVMEGASVLKARIVDLVAEASRDFADGFHAIKIAHERIDTAIMLMSQSYMKGAVSRARLDEAYRLFSLDQDIGIERESQRASLMEWSQKTLFQILGNTHGEALETLSGAPFGLWVRHRAGFMFENSAELQRIGVLIGRIDAELLPKLRARAGGDMSGPLGGLQASVDEIVFLLGEMFQGLTGMEVGRDPLTRALNRRFLPSILSREIGIANDNDSPLSILVLDIDHFKRVNDQWGHQVGDKVLRQVAGILNDHVRPSDFVFRYGGEEFLIALVETDLGDAAAVAERIRQALAENVFQSDSGQELRMTASIGIAGHEGHPDQDYLIKKADDALYRAKRNGRNRIEMAG